MRALEDMQQLEKLSAFESMVFTVVLNSSAEIPGTGPEKMVYEYLKRLRIRFQFQYHESDIESTSYPEDVYVPDFILPDYNTRINVFGSYWHSLPRRREKDMMQMARNLYDGRMVIEHGIPLEPSVGGATGKYVIWWEDEIYYDLDHLFTRDLPELFSADRIKGQPEAYLEDRDSVLNKMRAQKAGMISRKLKPKVHPITKFHRRLRKKQFDITKTYTFLRK
jgi:hypothetical protein